MKTSSRAGRMTIDLQAYKQAWIDHCAANGTTPSEAFRVVVAKLTEVPSDKGREVLDAADGRSVVRKEIRLTPAECDQAAALAATEGFSLARWIVALVRARLENAPQLGQFELEGLAKSNLQMLTLGRTLNQLAKVAASQPEAIAAYQARQIEQTAALVREHALLVSGVLNANTKRWRTK